MIYNVSFMVQFFGFDTSDFGTLFVLSCAYSVLGTSLWTSNYESINIVINIKWRKLINILYISHVPIHLF